MPEFASPAAFKASTDALERGYDQFVTVTRERLETVYPAAAEGFEQVAGFQKRCVDGVLKAGQAGTEGWGELGAKLTANTMATMDALFSMPRSWLGGGLFDEMDAALISLRERTASDLKTMEQRQAETLKAANEGNAEAVVAVKAKVADAAMAADEAKAEASQATKTGVEAKNEAAEAAKSVAALHDTLAARIEAQRVALDGQIVQTVDARIEEARTEIERETDEEVADKLAALKSDFEARLKAVEESAARELAALRAEVTELIKAKAEKAEKKAEAKKAGAKAGGKAKA